MPIPCARWVVLDVREAALTQKGEDAKMKSRLSPLTYPTTKEEEFKWGFDVYKPEGTPMAWIMDWSSAGPGYGISHQRAQELLEFNVPEDLSQLTVDEVVAALSSRWAMSVVERWRFMVRLLGETKATELLNTRTPGSHSEVIWKRLQQKFDSPLPLDKIIWYQDIIHIFGGPGHKAYSWCDDKKAVCCRSECALRPPKGQEEQAKWCRLACNGATDGYMAAEPTLYMVRAPDLGDKAEGSRCFHLWTYDKTVIEKLSEYIKDQVPETTRKVLAARGVRL
jgi:hypothetical protein